MALPTIWDLILPNWTASTFWGVILIILGIVVAIFGGLVLKPIKLDKYSSYLALGLIIIGLILTFVFSFIQDIFKSVELTIGLFGLIFLIILGIVLFKPKRRKRK